jgi:hypothetical protein
LRSTVSLFSLARSSSSSSSSSFYVMKKKKKDCPHFLLQGARFRDTSQQIHKQWQADPARAFPTVGSVAANSPSPGSGELSTPNSTPSPSPSPTNQQITVSA